jgi:hypothetical protein
MISTSLKYHIHELAHEGTLELIRYAAPELDNEQFQHAYLSVFQLLAGQMLKLIRLELADHRRRAADPCAH